MRGQPTLFLAVSLLAGSTNRTWSQQPAERGQPLSLDSAIQVAVQDNRRVKSTSLEVRKLEDRIAAARTRRLPQLNWYMFGAQRLTELNFRFPRGAFGSYPNIGPIPEADTSIRAPFQLSALLIGRVDQPLSQQYQIGLGLRQLEVGREIAREAERAERHAVIAEVKRTYYGIQQAQAALESIEEAIQLYRELDRVTEQYVLQQVALRSDGLDIKTRLARAEYEVLAIRNPLASQKEHLNSLLGRDITTEFQVSAVDEAAWIETELGAARKLALERRPEVKQARLKVRQADYERRLKKADFIPNLSLSFSYLSPVNYGSLVPANIAVAGLLLNWEPFDWGRKKHELAEKNRSIEQADLSLREVETQVTMEVNHRFRKLEEARQLLAVARLGRESMQEKLRVATNRYKQEAALLREVLQAQASLAEASHQYSQALLSFWTARADFERALGEPE